MGGVGASDLAASLWLAFDGGRAYPPEHEERIRRERELCDALAQLARRGEVLAIDFVTREVRIGPDASPLASPLFDDLVDAGLRAGLRQVLLQDDRDGIRALGLLCTLVAAARDAREEADGAREAAGADPVGDTRPVPLAPAPVGVPPNPETGVVEAVETLWSRIAEARDFDRAAADDLLLRIEELPGDGIEAPLRLFDEASVSSRPMVHAVNVSRLVRAAATAVCDDPEQVRTLVLCALLADIGMLAVSRELQQHEDHLAPDEAERMQRHPLLGARVLLATPALPEIVGVVAFEHHMRRDGRGYPDPPRPDWRCRPESLLVQAADTYAAIRAERPWRAALGEPEARSLMRQLAGAWLDREMVALLLDRAVPAGCLVPAQAVADDPETGA
ncbi:MAG: hypothetical protein D6738_14945 [Acidobacteria bacterium]|nr:MAG: hypothetical protein D6738_14945 [Acidobacteriota bacterium]